MFLIRRLYKLLLLSFFFFSAHAQFHRANNRSNIPYRHSFQRVATGSVAMHTLEIRNGKLWAWGYNEFGQLGDGTTTDRLAPVQIGTDDDWLYVAAAFAHSIAIKSDGTLWGWGFQPWSGSSGNPLVPVQIGTSNHWVGIVAGDSHNLALQSDGTLWTWGWNSAGELGLGNNDDAPLPVQVGTDHDWSLITAFSESSLAIKTNGTLWAWGYNGSGELGIGSFVDTNIPVQVGSNQNWTMVSGGSGSATAIQSDGSLWSWGGINGSSVPVQNGNDSNWVSVSGNWGMRSNGTIWNCGNNSFTQLGSDNDWVGVAANYDFNMAIKADGTLWTWGNNDHGQLGNGNLTAQSNPVSVGTVTQLLDLSAGQSHTLLLKSNGSLWSWGDNSSGQLGTGNLINQNRPVRIGNTNDWVAVAARSYNSAGIKADGSLWTWGLNEFGNLGDGSTLTKNSPVRIGTDNNWVAVEVGDMHMLGLKSDGSLWAWGKNSNGQLGDGTYTQRNTPVRINNENNWVAVAAGTTHSLAIKCDGTLWGWGWNAAGEVGDNTNIMRNTPVQIGSATNWVAVDAGDLFSLALKSDGSIWAWGSDLYGQLGNGSFSSSSIPIQVGAENNWVNIVAGVFHSAAIRSDGSLWKWGNNSNGQLGIGSTISSNLPVRVGSENNWLVVSGGLQHSVAAKSNRTAFCSTGGNSSGQLGDFSNTDKSVYACYGLSDCIPPAAPDVATVAPICPGTGTTLTATGTGNISWYSANSGGVWLGSGSVFTTPALYNNVTYYAQDSTCAPSARTAITVTVNGSTPDAPGVYTQYICDGDSALLTAYGAEGGTISWYSAPTGGNYLGSGPTFTSPVLHATGDTITTYFYYAQDSLCTASATRTSGMVLVYPATIPQFNPIAPLCKGDVPPTLPTTSLNGIQGSWNPNVISSTQSGTYVFTPSTGNYLECAVPVSIDVTIIDTPIAQILNLSGTNILSCSNTSISLSAVGGDLYEWNQGLGNNQVVTITAAGVYMVTVTNNSGCSSHDEITISGSTETITTPLVSGPVNVCNMVGSGIPVLFTVPVQSIPTTYTWTVPSNVQIVSGQGNDSLLLIFESGFENNRNKQIRVRAQSICGISNTYIHYLSAQLPSTPAQISGPNEVCANTNFSLPAIYSIESVASAAGYLWQISADASIIQNNGQSVAVVFYESFSTGVISVRAYNPCGVSSTRYITVRRSRPVTPGLINGPVNVCQYLPDSLHPEGRSAVYKINLLNNTTGYIWTLPAGASLITQGNNGLFDSIVVAYTTFSGGQIAVRAINNCGISEPRTLSLNRLLPGYPAEISGPTDICTHLEPNGTAATYNVAAGSNSTTYLWTLPAGASNIVGQGTNVIRFLYPGNYYNGLISVRAINGCGSSNIRTLFVSRGFSCNRNKPFITNNRSSEYHTESRKIPDVLIFPNPSSQNASLRLFNFNKKEIVTIIIFDQLGRKVKLLTGKTDLFLLGDNWKAGVYFVQVVQGDIIIRKKMIRN